MTRKFRKHYVNVAEATELFRDGYGLIPKTMNFYQIRLKHEESREMFDWYHTQGTVVVTKDGIPRRWKKSYGDAENLAMDIIKYIYAKEENKIKTKEEAE